MTGKNESVQGGSCYNSVRSLTSSLAEGNGLALGQSSILCVELRINVMCEGEAAVIASDGTSQIPVTCAQSQGIVSEVSGGGMINSSLVTMK